MPMPMPKLENLQKMAAHYEALEKEALTQVVENYNTHQKNKTTRPLDTGDLVIVTDYQSKSVRHGRTIFTRVFELVTKRNDRLLYKVFLHPTEKVRIEVYNQIAVATSEGLGKKTKVAKPRPSRQSKMTTEAEVTPAMIAALAKSINSNK